MRSARKRLNATHGARDRRLRLKQSTFEFPGCATRGCRIIRCLIHLRGDDSERTIYIGTVGVKARDFGLSAARTEALLMSGEKHTEAYFKWFDDIKTDSAVNHFDVNS